MTLLVVGLSHHTAPVPLLERVALSGDDADKALHELLRRGHVAEAMVLSTCNRVEVYADVDRFHGGLTDVSVVLARHAGIEIGDLADHLYVHYDSAAVEHLFSVAAGLDSMVVGEQQILGQLRSGYQRAVDAEAVGRSLHELIQRALRAGKRVRTETGIDRAGASLVSVALDEAAAAIGPLAGRPALVVGAGSMGGLAVATLVRAGAGPITVVNRTVANAERLAASVDGRAAGLDALPELLASHDVVLAATGSASLVIPYELAEDAAAARAGAPLAVLDLALPRDADGAIGGLPGITYIDLALLGEKLAGGERDHDLEAAGRIVAAEVAGYLQALRAAVVAPTVTALRARAAEVMDAELLRLDQRQPGMDAELRDDVARTVRRVVNTLLHTPTVRAKELAGGPDGDVYAAALRDLFGLDPAAPRAVSTPNVAITDGEQ